MQEEKKHYILIASSITLFILFYFVFFASPTLKGIKNYQRRVVIKEKEFKEFNNFIIEHRRYSGFSKNLNLPLLSFLEEKIKELNIGKKAVYLRTPSGNENIIELSFANLTAPEVIKFLYELETNFIQIKEFSLKDYELKGDWSIKMLLGEI